MPPGMQKSNLYSHKKLLNVFKFALLAITYYFSVRNKGTSSLPDMYTQSQAQGLRVYIFSRPRVPVLQILCNTNTFNYICSVAYTFPLWFSVS